MTTPDDNDVEAAARWHAQRRQRLAENLLKGRPDAFATAGELDPRLKVWARMLADGDSQNLILTGPVGSGKTWAIWHAAEEAVRSGYEGRVVITSAAKLRRAIAPSTADPAMFTRCGEAGLLAIDDLGAFGLSEWDLDNLTELIDIRWSEQRPTVVTSNATDLRALLGERIASRLAHHALVIEMDGSDQRRQS